MPIPLTGKDKATFINGLQNLCQHILFPKLSAGAISAVTAHFAALHQRPDGLYAQVDFETITALGQTKITITATVVRQTQGISVQ